MKSPAPLRILAVVGTRPEVIKTAPVVRCLSAEAELFSVAVCKVEQQDGVLDAACAEWALQPNHTIQPRLGRRTPPRQLSAILPELEDLFYREKPDLILVQGDT
ncbi:MAG: non-hydrolyzing UDP-N-acetylglucosamine 2-epimerase, partial [Gemmataceae bacterium]